MKKFSNYQYVGGEMSERDKKEEGSKFWNKGKWDNFVLPFLPEDCSDMSLVDIGCNAGVFLKLAEDKGFRRVIGVDADKESYRKALEYRESNGGKYEIQRRHMESSLDKLPVVDYTILANTHYYFSINDWLDYLDKLVTKTRYCIIVTAAKKERRYKAPSDTDGIKFSFRNWKLIGEVPQLPLEGDPFPRRQWSFCFESPLLERVPIDSLDCGNHVQDACYDELDKGVDILKTRYYRILKKYRRNSWSEEKLLGYMEGKVKIYESVLKNGILKPITINSKNRIIDGNHRYTMLKHLGYKSVIVRKVL